MMPAMPTSLHLCSLLEPKTKKKTHLCNVMGVIAFSYKPNPAAAQYLLMPVSSKTVSMLLMQGRCFAVNVEHADLHGHVETNGRSAVTAESSDNGYLALMLTID